MERRAYLLPRQKVYGFNLLPEPDHKRPGMINLQQYYLEGIWSIAAMKSALNFAGKTR